jgi:very-short-patch-repair endonuclease
MRRRPTRAEYGLWQELRRSSVDGVKFRRQQAIGPLIADFYCVSARLVIEVDGRVHSHQRGADKERQAYLEGLGSSVLRFTNEDVLERMSQVLARIAEVVQEHTRPSPRKERGLGER